jgi:quercetin dioxygenase-like cupin family protein
MKTAAKVTLLVALANATWAQNPPAKGAAAGRTSSSAVENEYIRVTKVTQAPHQRTRPHQHNTNRVMVYLTPGTQVNEYQDGKKEVLEFKAGEPLWSAAGGIHVAEVTSEQPITIVEMELRKPTGKDPATMLDPLKVDARHYKLEFENNQVRVFRVTIGAHESAPLHEHVLNRVVVYLTDQNLRVTGSDGKAETQNRHAGDIVWAEAGKHQEQNVSDKPFEAIVVELK